MNGLRALCLVCVAGTTPGCHAKQSKLIAGGISSGVAIASAYSLATAEGYEDSVLLTATAITAGMFGLFALLSGLDHQEPDERPRPLVIPMVDHRDEAWEYTKVAQVAGRSGDCGAVLAYGRVVRNLDATFHDIVFARDVAIARCMSDPNAWPSALLPPSTAPQSRSPAPAPAPAPPAPDTPDASWRSLPER